MKAGQFQPIKDRLSKRMSDWNEKYMSSGAKDVLIKSVAQALPTYTMGIFKMTDKFCEEVSQMIRNFWWGHEKGEKKVHWIAWEKITSLKIHGGLGFRDMKCFNQALLAKQAWRLITTPESLCARVLKAKYFPSGSLLDIAFPTVSFPTWKGVQYGLDLIKQGIIWRRWVAQGERVNVLWKNARNRLIYVNELMEPGLKSWNENLVRHVMNKDDAEEVLKIRLSECQPDDFPASHLEKSGLFTVKSAYRLAWNLSNHGRSDASSSDAPSGERKIWFVLWKTKVPAKIKIFAWKLARYLSNMWI
jgi:hypothetical protein